MAILPVLQMSNAGSDELGPCESKTVGTLSSLRPQKQFIDLVSVGYDPPGLVGKASKRHFQVDI